MGGPMGGGPGGVQHGGYGQGGGRAVSGHHRGDKGGGGGGGGGGHSSFGQPGPYGQGGTGGMGMAGGGGAGWNPAGPGGAGGARASMEMPNIQALGKKFKYLYVLFEQHVLKMRFLFGLYKYDISKMFLLPVHTFNNKINVMFEGVECMRKSM